MQRSGPAPDSFARWQLRLVLYAIAFLSFGNFDMALFGMGSGQPTSDMHVSDATSPQQYAIFALWLAAIGLSFMPHALRWKRDTRGTGWLLAFYGYAALSAVWCPEIRQSLPKAIVFLICSFGAWRMTATFSIDDFIEIVRRSLFAVMIGCLLAVIINPAVGITHDWMHGGDWKGVFEQKQELGITGAFFLFLTLMRLLRRFRWMDAAGLLLGILLVFESGSRGGAIIAGLAPFVILLARRRPGRVALVFSTVVTLEICIVAAELTYLAWTGDKAIHIGDLTLDFTQRTYIWSFALAHWQARPWLGYGLNGFWTNPQNIWDFARVYRWVLNDYHSGYLAILVQTGATGMLLFLLMVRHLCRDLRRVLNRPGSQPALEAATGLLIMLFTINMTETSFLRSTNFNQCMFSFLAFSVIALAQPWPVRRMAQVPAVAE